MTKSYRIIEKLTSHHLKDLHSRVDILQPCVSFNRINTYQYYRERVYKLESPVADRFEAMKTAETWGERIPIGIIYKHEGVPVRETGGICL